MTRVALATALACLALASALAAMAYGRLGLARRWFASRAPRRGGRRAPGPVRIEGTLEPAGDVVRAPFSDRAVVYVRAALRGVPPGGGPPRVLWEKVLVAPARVRADDGDDDAGGATTDVPLAGAEVLAPREYRRGALRALLVDARVLPRVLARAGYTTAPPASQFFELEEEVLEPGDAVVVLGERDASGALRPPASGALFVTNLNPLRVALRAAWGPALALLLALIIAMTGGSVLAAWWWLR